MFSKQTIVVFLFFFFFVFFFISELFVQDHYVENFMFLSNTSFSAILEKVLLETTKLASVLNADNPLYRLFRVT